MTESEIMQIKGALRKCAKENEGKATYTGHVIVSSVCNAAADRIEELEKQIGKMKCCGNCIHCYEGAYHNGYRCKDHARESVCDNWEMMTEEVRNEMLEDD